MTDRPYAHTDLPDSGRTSHFTIDEQLPEADEKQMIHVLTTNAPVTVTGARDETEGALANLLAALATLGLITNSTTAS
ncbi:MAG TPA: hypothetical protein VMX14_13380 [Anaerolineae bacterium]|nr:hypothetical protein [Anaerolineae bacterium]